jgi:hypothetical protein
MAKQRLEHPALQKNTVYTMISGFRRDVNRVVIVLFTTQRRVIPQKTTDFRVYTTIFQCVHTSCYFTCKLM